MQNEKCKINSKFKAPNPKNRGTVRLTVGSPTSNDMIFCFSMIYLGSRTSDNILTRRGRTNKDISQLAVFVGQSSKLFRAKSK